MGERLSFESNTKLAKVRDAMARDDWDSAIRLAAKFPSLGQHDEAIQRDKDAISSPELYLQLGYDLEAVRSTALQP